MYVSAIVVAAGKGERLNSKVSKQFLELGGRPILAHTIDKFQKCPLVDEILVVTSEDYMEFCRAEIVEKYKFNKVKGIIKGGEKRQKSVYCGLKALDPKSEIVLIHDGVRPFIDNYLLEDFIKCVKKYSCCVMGVPSKDTIKICDKDNFISDTPERNRLWAAQTPQGFLVPIILDAHKNAEKKDYEASDDSVLVEKNGHPVKMVMGSYFNIKITTKEDLAFAGSILHIISKEV